MGEDPAVGVARALRSCRCCLRRAPDRDLDTPHTHRGNTETYADMLKECFDIHLALVGKCGICEGCISRLRDARDFKLQVQRSQTELQVWLERALRALGEKSSDESERVDSNVGEDSLMRESDGEHSVKTESDDGANSEGESRSLSCEDEAPDTADPGRAVSLSAREQLVMACSVKVEHLQDHQAPHQCQICHLTFDYETSLTTHMRVHSETKQEYDTAVVDENRKFICDTCGKQFVLEHWLNKHKQNESCVKSQMLTSRKSSHKSVRKGLKPHVCEVCNKQFRRKHYLDQHKCLPTGVKPHLEPPQNTVKAFACKICSKKFQCRTNLLHHQLIHKNLKPYSCQVCKKRFTQKNHLEQHNFIHKGVKPHSCENCHLRFFYKSRLHEHVCTRNIKRFTCDTCNKSFPLKLWLIRHIQQKKCIYCEICSKSFSSKQKLADHQLIHDQLKPYVCVTCNKQFRRIDQLKLHQFVHGGVKPHACDICDRRFTYKSRVDKHMLQHISRRKRVFSTRFTCDACKKSFVKKQYLIKHIQEKKCIYCKICSKLLSSKGSLADHRLIHDQLKPYACGTCNKQFRRKFCLNRHQLVHGGVKPHACEICHRRFIYESELDKHKLQHISGPKRGFNTRFTCDACKKSFVIKRWLIKHVQEKKCTSIYCEICSKLFSSKRSLADHRLIHKQLKPYACGTCNKQFRRKDNLRRHQLVHRGVKPHACEICHRRFLHESELDKHKLRHISRRKRAFNTRFTCDACKKSFVIKRYLIKHIQEKKCIYCEICSKFFASKQNFAAHQLIHEQLKPYACGTCNKQFRRKFCLNRHQLVHGGVKPHACEICHRRFIYESELDKHKLQHISGSKRGFNTRFTCDACKKSFVIKRWLIKHVQEKKCTSIYCEICSKLFSCKRSLAVHQLIHEQLKPYACGTCNKQFRRKDHLKQHQFVHGGVKPYACEICQRRYLYESELDRHKLRHFSRRNKVLITRFTCDACKTSFAKKGWLIRHIQEKKCELFAVKSVQKYAVQNKF